MEIAAYCRVSTAKEEQLDSLQNQKDFFAQYARQNGHNLVQVYADEGISGTSLKNRDEFNRLMRDARAGLFEAVVVKDVSRLARNTVDFLVSVRELKSMGINVLFINSNMDSLGDSEFILTVFSALAQEESSNISRRTKFGKRINAEKGRVPQMLFGYDRIDNYTLSINPEEAGIVRKIFTLYNEQGLGCRSISMRLNQDGDRTKCSGNHWDSRGVRRILTNPIYRGILVNHKYEVADYLTGKQVRVPEEEQFYHDRPEWAIVSPDVFEKTQKILESRRVKYDSGTPFRQGRYSGRHLFSTLIKCEVCGRSFTRKTYTYRNTRVFWRCVTNDQQTTERCNNNITLNEPDLIDALKEYVSSLIPRQEAFIAEVLATLQQKIPKAADSSQTRRELEAKRKKLLTRKERYQQMFANDLISLPELKAKLGSIENEVQTVNKALEQIRQSAGTGNPAEQRKHQCTEEIQRFLALDNITNADLRRLIDHISVNRDGSVQIVLKKVGDRSGF